MHSIVPWTKWTFDHGARRGDGKTESLEQVKRKTVLVYEFFSNIFGWKFYKKNLTHDDFLPSGLLYTVAKL